VERAEAEALFRRMMPHVPLGSVGDETIMEMAEDWASPAMSIRDRRLVSLTCTAYVPGPGLEAHLRAALLSGDFDEPTLREWTLHLRHYAGWPVGAYAARTLEHVISTMSEPTAGDE
jgi:alkylhydroperoxidase/carboxymuconolactone decarboxylase family protein YurZ